MIIKVTKSHISRGFTNRSDTCPVALAIREQTPFTDAKVGCYYVYKQVGKLRLPRVATDWIDQFDAVGIGSPFEFELEFTQ